MQLAQMKDFMFWDESCQIPGILCNAGSDMTPAIVVEILMAVVKSASIPRT